LSSELNCSTGNGNGGANGNFMSLAASIGHSDSNSLLLVTAASAAIVTALVAFAYSCHSGRLQSSTQVPLLSGQAVP